MFCLSVFPITWGYSWDSQNIESNIQRSAFLPYRFVPLLHHTGKQATASRTFYLFSYYLTQAPEYFPHICLTHCILSLHSIATLFLIFLQNIVSLRPDLHNCCNLLRLELHCILLTATISVTYPIVTYGLPAILGKRSMIRHSRRDDSHRDCRVSSILCDKYKYQRSGVCGVSGFPFSVSLVFCAALPL